MDIKRFTKDLIDGGMEKKAAELKVKEWITKIRGRLGEDVTDEKVMSVISQHLIKMKLVASSGEKFVGVCVGYGRKMDRNKKTFDKMAELVTKATMNPADPGYDPAKRVEFEQKIKNGEIKEIVDEKSQAKGYIPVDTRQFIDKAGKIENFSYMKPLRHRIERTGYFIINNEIVSVVGDFDCQTGREYAIYGKKTPNLIRVGKMGITATRTFTPSELWTLLYDVAAEDPRSSDLSGVAEVKPYAFGITNAFVKDKMQTSNSSWKVTLYDAGNMRGVGGFAGNEDSAAVIELANLGDEVIALYEQGQPKGNYPASPSFVGIFTNPESSDVSILDDDVEIVDGE
jgi:hypothetical protein